MIAFPNCKINLGLHILAKRVDGFHDLETVYLPVPFEDCLEVLRTKDETSLTVTGIPVEGNIENNLCMKAYSLLKSKFDLPPLAMHLHKQIPTGSGLGGGSADGAFTLSLLNAVFNLKLNKEDLIDIASQLGSDCAFFIANKACIGTERGNQLEPINLPQLQGLYCTLIMPGIHISSAWAFQQIVLKKHPKRIKEVITTPVAEWKQALVNDFEIPVFKTHPELKKVKDQLYEAGAQYASLSGSGSAMYGLFHSAPTLPFPPNYIVKTFPLASMES